MIYVSWWQKRYRVSIRTDSGLNQQRIEKINQQS